jgi:sirohydrochlorin ferrochelatase
MAIGITFDKRKAEYFVDRLNRGAAIEGVETTEDMLALLGACRYVVATRAPTVHPGTRRAELPVDRRRAVRESLASDIGAAVEWLTEATRMVIAGEYDARFEARHYAVAEAVEEGEKRWKVVVTRGQRERRDPEPRWSREAESDCEYAARAG